MKVKQVLLLLLGVMAAGSCGQPDARQLRMEELVRHVKEVAAPEMAVRLRYNPAECECPPFELALKDRWIRVDVVYSSDPVRPLDTFSGQCEENMRNGKAGEYDLGLSLDSSTPQYCKNGTIYFRVALVPLPEPEEEE